MTPQPVNEQKLRELILYIAERMEKDQHAGQGRIKLAKLLWLSDFQAYLELGHSITGTRYVADELGPAPVDELLAVRDLEGSGRLTLDPGYRRQRLPRAQRPADTAIFGSDELAIVNELLDRFRCWTGKELVDLAHEHPGYKLVHPDEEVPYDSAFLPTEPPPQAAVELGRQLIREGRWGNTST
jgi:hypothetical protein